MYSTKCTPAHLTAFHEHLMHWFTANRRSMPWREDPTPYKVWIAEIMLQQTRVDQVRPYFERFISAFPDVYALADASQDKVLRIWEGLGYYSRARNLHKSAQIIVSEHKGVIPSSLKALLALPGIGPYTAAAILSIAYNQPYAAVDGNVIRVLTRVFGIKEDVTLHQTRTALQHLADCLLFKENPGDFNQALMELGALICTPRSPQCNECPLRQVCVAHHTDQPEKYPVKQRRKRIPHFHVAVGILQNDAGELLITRRPENSMLGGLWEFPGGKVEPGESPAQACRREFMEELNIEIAVGPQVYQLQHTYTHFRITLHAFLCTLISGVPQPADNRPLQWVSPEALDHFAFPRANRKLIQFLKAQIFLPSIRPVDEV